MRALRLVAHGSPGRFELLDIPEPEPGVGEVVVRVRACGLNRLDLWHESGALPIPLTLPRTPGCEIAGEIARVGPEVEDWVAGARVAIQSNLFCGRCEFCRTGQESLCLDSMLLGVQRDGGLAEQVLTPASSLVALPAEVGFPAAAALTLAGSTAMHMLTDRVRVAPGAWLLVVGGASGVGSAAIQIAKGLGARVIATGSTAPKRQLSLSLGAEFAVDASMADWPGEVRKLTGRRGVDVVVEHVGGEVLERVFHCLARGGTVVTCGATIGREPKLDLWPFFVKQQRLIGSYGRNRADMRATLEWLRDGKLRAVIDRVLPLERAAEGFAALRAREVLGKTVIEVGPTID